jgi:microcystin degradation protein MlrC
MARIAVGGVQHETNVFAPYQAGYEVFRKLTARPVIGCNRFTEISVNQALPDLQ